MQSPLMMSGWPTTIGIGGPLPPCYQGSPSPSVWWSSPLSKKRPLTLRAAPLCHVIFATLRAAIEASGGRQRFPKNAARRSRSLWLCSIYTLSTPDWKSFTSGGGNSLLRLRRCIPGNFLQIPLQFLFVSPSADQLLTAHSTLERTPSAIPMKAVGSP